MRVLAVEVGGPGQCPVMRSRSSGQTGRPGRSSGPWRSVSIRSGPRGCGRRRRRRPPPASGTAVGPGDGDHPRPGPAASERDLCRGGVLRTREPGEQAHATTFVSLPLASKRGMGVADVRAGRGGLRAIGSTSSRSAIVLRSLVASGQNTCAVPTATSNDCALSGCLWDVEFDDPRRCARGLVLDGDHARPSSESGQPPLDDHSGQAGPSPPTPRQPVHMLVIELWSGFWPHQESPRVTCRRRGDHQQTPWPVGGPGVPELPGSDTTTRAPGLLSSIQTRPP